MKLENDIQRHLPIPNYIIAPVYGLTSGFVLRSDMKQN